MQAPGATAGTPADGGVAAAPVDRVQPNNPTGPAGGVSSPEPTAGDRILANMSRGPVGAPAQAVPQAAEPVGAKPSIDIGSPMDSFELQMQVAQVKATTGLAASATQKSAQDVDTLLKSQ